MELGAFEIGKYWQPLCFSMHLSNTEVDVEAAWEGSFAHSAALEITALSEGSSAIASEVSDALSPVYDSEMSSGSEGTEFSSLPNTPGASFIKCAYAQI